MPKLAGIEESVVHESDPGEYFINVVEFPAVAYILVPSLENEAPDAKLDGDAAFALQTCVRMSNFQNDVEKFPLAAYKVVELSAVNALPNVIPSGA